VAVLSYAAMNEKNGFASALAGTHMYN